MSTAISPEIEGFWGALRAEARSIEHARRQEAADSPGGARARDEEGPAAAEGPHVLQSLSLRGTFRMDVFRDTSMHMHVYTYIYINIICVYIYMFIMCMCIICVYKDIDKFMDGLFREPQCGSDVWKELI